jgi:hypothetical protein
MYQFTHYYANVMESGYEQIYGDIYDYGWIFEENDEFEEDSSLDEEEENEEIIYSYDDLAWFPGLDDIAES